MESKEGADWLIISMPDGTAYAQRKRPVSSSEDPLTKQEEMILFLNARYEKIKIQLDQKRYKDKIDSIQEDLFEEAVEYFHPKSGKIYSVSPNSLINSTNGDNEGQEMILYKNSEGETFVREKKEFEKKFEKL